MDCSLIYVSLGSTYLDTICIFFKVFLPHRRFRLYFLLAPHAKLGLSNLLIFEDKPRIVDTETFLTNYLEHNPSKKELPQKVAFSEPSMFSTYSNHSNWSML